ncbi:hypothetical protein KSF_058890 [Reticulibacter mediterranei]|uniref:Uncharacterized protein n=1 Tax=Reticulibacter mediterranei TaxID=2778369 RepID=A0A8J3IV58_9CHLR|nr:hypothetical protein KSF_058890 [Reticulibacter mediterranei]
MGIKRKLYLNEDLHPSACYRDLFPKLDGHYLLRDYETTLAYINAASRNTAKGKAPLYALWLLSETVEDMAALIQWDLEEEDQARSSTSLRTSAGCAPETPYFSSMAKNGTP